VIDIILLPPLDKARLAETEDGRGVEGVDGRSRKSYSNTDHTQPSQSFAIFTELNREQPPDAVVGAVDLGESVGLRPMLDVCTLCFGVGRC
jgi:hypothetical protein